MAPFRNRDRSNRSGRGQVEHNVLEGLPINQYREIEITIGPNATENKQLDKDDWPDPPMPRDSHLLPEHSQQILARARSGRIYKPPAPPEEDKETMDEEEEHKEVRQGFTIKKWTKVPRHLEEPEPEYLAKRRKGLPSQYGSNGAAASQSTLMRETKVKKIDADGNVNVYKVLVPEGQAVEGEVHPSDAIADAAVPAPGTVVEGVGIVNADGVVVASDLLQQTPPRRRPPPPKKKKKSGPGRGKKKVLFLEGTAEQETPISSTGTELLTVPGLKQEGSVEPSEGGDTPMPDAADEDEGSGEEASDEEEHEEHEQSVSVSAQSPTPAHVLPSPTNTAHTTSGPYIKQAKADAVGTTQLAETTLPDDAQPDLSNQTSAAGADTIAPKHSTSPVHTSVDHQITEPRHTNLSDPSRLSLSNTLDQPATIPPTKPSAPESTLPEGTSALIATNQMLPIANIETLATDAHVSDGEPDLLGSLERQLEQDSETLGTR